MKRTTLIYIIGMVLGTALFTVLALFVNLPLGFAGLRAPFEFGILAAFAAVFGPAPGMVIGFLGGLLAGIFRGELWWSEVLATMFMGTMIGFCQRMLSIGDGGFEPRGLITYAGFTAAASVLCWVLLCPALDLFLYHLDFGSTFVLWALCGAAVLLTALVVGGLLCLACGMVCRKKPLL